MDGFLNALILLDNLLVLRIEVLTLEVDLLVAFLIRDTFIDTRVFIRLRIVVFFVDRLVGFRVTLRLTVLRAFVTLRLTVLRARLTRDLTRLLNDLLAILRTFSEPSKLICCICNYTKP